MFSFSLSLSLKNVMKCSLLLSLSLTLSNGKLTWDILSLSLSPMIITPLYLLDMHEWFYFYLFCCIPWIEVIDFEVKILEFSGYFHCCVLLYLNFILRVLFVVTYFPPTEEFGREVSCYFDWKFDFFPPCNWFYWKIWHRDLPKLENATVAAGLRSLV